uniref:Tick transposon n=1 Tax=Anopheles marajoara TaxID=58244 RepID=A0A2M4BWK7_9DIPT
MELGDRRPSELFADMRHAANTALSETVLQDLWASRLPAHAQSAVIAFRGTIAEKMAVADAIIDSLSLRGMSGAGPARLNAVASPSSSEMSELRQMVADLTRSVVQLSTLVSRRRSRSRGRSTSRPREESGHAGPQVCFYHRRYGNEARNCIPPCSHSATAPGPTGQEIDRQQYSQHSQQSSNAVVCSLVTIEELMERFFEIEEVKESNNWSTEEAACENHYKMTTTRAPDGRYVVQLPRKPETINTLDESKSIALRRFLANERKLQRNPATKTAAHVIYGRIHKPWTHESDSS